MDPELLVDDRLEDGQRLVSQLFMDGFEVTAAFWVRTSQEGLSHLYIASPSVNGEKIGEAYGIVYTSLSKVPSPWISLSEIKLVSPSNPMTRDVLELQRRHPGRTPLRTRRPHLGGLSIDE